MLLVRIYSNTAFHFASVILRFTSFARRFVQNIFEKAKCFLSFASSTAFVQTLYAVY